jgi:cycloeucalenol cycloisomerase
MAEDPKDFDIAWAMTMILGTMIATLVGIAFCQDRVVAQTVSCNQNNWKNVISHALPNPTTQPSKYAYELFVWYYTPVWISGFAVTIYFQLYEDFTAQTYTWFGLTWAAPLLMQPIVWPMGRDAARPWLQRYAFKANLWLAVYSFIGNYWYTHYFYSVLKASYTMPSQRLNNVPLAMYLCTHFYFSTYHALSNAALRYIITSFNPGVKRTILFFAVVVVLSYFTAFSETLSISAFPYYSFEDRYMAYTIGSAFYGIYFLVSYPAFYYFDQDVDAPTPSKQVTFWDTIVSSCGYGMMILFLLDWVRLYLGIALVINIGPRVTST